MGTDRQTILLVKYISPLSQLNCPTRPVYYDTVTTLAVVYMVVVGFWHGKHRKEAHFSVKMTGPEQSSWRILTFSKRSNETISVPTKWLLFVGSKIPTKFQTTPIY